MDALRRNQYLQAMGVDVWVPRRSVEAEAGGATAAIQAAATTDASHAMSAPVVASATQVGADRGGAAAATVARGTGHASAVVQGAESMITTWESLRSEVLA